MGGENKSAKTGRRKFLLNAGRAACAVTLGGVALRVLSAYTKEETAGPKSHWVWQIDPQKCAFCDKCETACVRKPSAVKAVNDHLKCSYCVVCYGHISDRYIASDKIEPDGKRVCPYDAVTRKNYSGGKDGYFMYDIDDKNVPVADYVPKSATKRGRNQCT